MKHIFKNRVIKITSVDGINSWDHPDYVDAFISEAFYIDTSERLTENELEELNEDQHLVYECVLNRIY